MKKIFYTIYGLLLFLGFGVSAYASTGYILSGFTSSSGNVDGTYCSAGTLNGKDYYTTGSGPEYIYIFADNNNWGIDPILGEQTNMDFYNAVSTGGALDSATYNPYVGGILAGTVTETTCGGGGGGGDTPTGVAAWNNNYIFLISSLSFHVINLFSYLVIAYILALILGWPVKYFMRAFISGIKGRGYRL